MSESPDLTLDRRGRCGVATLNRPKALNAISYDMIARMEEAYIDWAGNPDVYGIVLRSENPRAFCSGGDIKALYEWRKAGKLDTILDLYTSEYQHNWTLDRFTKPHVALMNGYVFGGGVGISLYGTHKVAGEKYRFAMPEAGIGFFPDVGASYFLPRLPGHIGLYLALTGAQIGRADAYALGLLTHCIDSKEFDAILNGMIEADPIDPALDSRHVDPGPSPLLAMQDVIDRHFSLQTVEEILQSLDDADAEHAEWAQHAKKQMIANAQFSLKVDFHKVRNTGKPTLEQALTLDARIAYTFLTGDDFYEGVRALLIDKDGKPSWSPDTLSGISNESVLDCFKPRDDISFRPINPFV